MKRGQLPGAAALGKQWKTALLQLYLPVPQIRAMETANSSCFVLPVSAGDPGKGSDGDQLRSPGKERQRRSFYRDDRALYEAWWSHPAETAPPGGERALARSMSAAVKGMEGDQSPSLQGMRRLWPMAVCWLILWSSF